MALVLLAASSAIATARFCGRPEPTSSKMFELTVFCEEPFANGIIYPKKYVTLIDCPVPGTTTRPEVNIRPAGNTPAVVPVKHSALDEGNPDAALKL